MTRSSEPAGVEASEALLSMDAYAAALERDDLPLLRRAAADHGSVPAEVQERVLEPLLLYFRADQRALSTIVLGDEVGIDRFHALVEEVLRYIDVETINRFSTMPASRDVRAALIAGYKHERYVPSELHVEALDADQQLVNVRYFCGRPLPIERIRLDGRPAVPNYAKTRDLPYFGRVLVHERILWLPAAAEIRIELDGRPIPLTSRPGIRGMGGAVPTSRRLKGAARTRLPAAVRLGRRVQRFLIGRTRPPAPSTDDSGPFAAIDPRHDERILRMARSRRTRHSFAAAWTFMDRDTEAHDNAEHLYRFVRECHPDINAWFVLRRESPDWDRLATEGFRLVPFGSVEHVVLLLNTEHLISSQIDPYVYRPLNRARFGPSTWRFTYLAHGVNHNDLSRWLNGKPIDRFVTACVAEHAEIIGDHTPYAFTEKEVRLVGFSRHDRLLELRRRAGKPDLLLVMPTWRRWVLERATSGNARKLKSALSSTVFGRTWFDLIGSPELRTAAVNSGLEIAFVPHPNVRPHLSADDVPTWVRTYGYDDSDIQELLARAAITVTDYSSQAFEAAYVECPVVYYQFDRDEFFSGAHAYRRGRWDYDADGFGPVVTTQDDALRAIRNAIADERPAEPYLARMRSAFAHHDGRCRERTVASIRELTMPARDADAERAAPLARGQPVDTSPMNRKTRG